MFSTDKPTTESSAVVNSVLQTYIVNSRLINLPEAAEKVFYGSVCNLNWIWINLYRVTVSIMLFARKYGYVLVQFSTPRTQE